MLTPTTPIADILTTLGVDARTVAQFTVLADAGKFGGWSFARTLEASLAIVPGWAPASFFALGTSAWTEGLGIDLATRQIVTLCDASRPYESVWTNLEEFAASAWIDTARFHHRAEDIEGLDVRRSLVRHAANPALFLEHSLIRDDWPDRLWELGARSPSFVSAMTRREPSVRDLCERTRLALREGPSLRIALYGWVVARAASRPEWSEPLLRLALAQPLRTGSLDDTETLEKHQGALAPRLPEPARERVTALFGPDPQAVVGRWLDDGRHAEARDLLLDIATLRGWSNGGVPEVVRLLDTIASPWADLVRLRVPTPAAPMPASVPMGPVVVRNHARPIGSYQYAVFRRLTWDDAGRLCRILEPYFPPDMQTHTFSYDAAGRLTGVHIEKGARVAAYRLTYDTHGRYTHITYHSPPDGPAASTLSVYSYEGQDLAMSLRGPLHPYNLVEMTLPGKTQDFLAFHGRVRRETVENGATTQIYDAHYDAQGRFVLGEGWPDADMKRKPHWRVVNTWEDDRLITSTNEPQVYSDRKIYAYDARGLPIVASELLGESETTRTEWVWDDEGRLVLERTLKPERRPQETHWVYREADVPVKTSE